MNRSTIIDRLRAHESELRAAGIEHMRLHGSYARETAVRDVSDVDVIVDFDGRKPTLIGVSIWKIARRIFSVSGRISPTENCFGQR